jgi:hypothetical protein
MSESERSSIDCAFKTPMLNKKCDLEYLEKNVRLIVTASQAEQETRIVTTDCDEEKLKVSGGAKRHKKGLQK